MKNTQKISHAFILLMVLVSAFLFVHCNTKSKTETTPINRSLADKKANLEKRKKWEASPDGIKYKEWENSPEGKKIHASHDKIRIYINTFANIEAEVTSVTFQRTNAHSSGPKWLVVKIGDDQYMMQFGLKEFEKLKSLKVNDQIILRSRSVGFSPNHPYLILSGDYIAKDNKVLFKRDFSKNNGC